MVCISCVPTTLYYLAWVSTSPAAILQPRRSVVPQPPFPPEQIVQNAIPATALRCCGKGLPGLSGHFGIFTGGASRIQPQAALGPQVCRSPSGTEAQTAGVGWRRPDVLTVKPASCLEVSGRSVTSSVHLGHMARL